MAAEKLDKNLFRLSIPFDANTGWEWWCLLTSDRHWDNPDSDWELQKKHLEQARERGATVIDLGDFFCAMQGQADHRKKKGKLRPEHNVPHYFDALVDTATDFFGPYAELFAVIASGNHEDSVAKNQETNLIERLCATVKERTGHKIHHGGYGGNVVFQFKAKGKNQFQQIVVLKYYHGSGGGGESSAGMAKAYREAARFPSADIIASGHTHDAWIREIGVEKLTQQTVIKQEVKTLIRCPTYKDEYKAGFDGWHVRTGKPPKPIGAVWLRFYFSRKLNRVLWQATMTER